MSDEDFFQSSQRESRPTTEVPRFVSKTQPQPTDVDYHWVVLFHWDLENPSPFTLHLRALFQKEEIPETWFLFKLRNDLRMKKKYFEVLNGTYSVFCKVEKGKKKKSVFLIFSDLFHYSPLLLSYKKLFLLRHFKGKP